MCKLAHVIRYTVPYKIFIFAILERLLIYDYEAECNVVLFI